MIDLTPIINALILLVAGAISSFLIPWLKRKIDESRMAELYSWVKIGVAAAEQIYRGVGKGEEKKQYVLEYLAQHGYDINLESINAMIEAAVQQLNSVIGLEIG